MQLDNYRERKQKGLIKLTPTAGDKKVMASATMFDQFTGLSVDSQEVFLNIDDLETQRAQIAEIAERQLAELDAVIADVKAILPKPKKPEK